MIRKGAEEILKEALQLSESERARVAAELLTSLGPDVETHSGDARIAEVERQAKSLDRVGSIGSSSSKMALITQRPPRSCCVNDPCGRASATCP